MYERFTRAAVSRDISPTPRLPAPLYVALCAARLSASPSDTDAMDDEKRPLFAPPTTDASAAGPKPIWKENKDNKIFVSEQNSLEDARQQVTGFWNNVYTFTSYKVYSWTGHNTAVIGPLGHSYSI